MTGPCPGETGRRGHRAFTRSRSAITMHSALQLCVIVLSAAVAHGAVHGRAGGGRRLAQHTALISEGRGRSLAQEEGASNPNMRSVCLNTCSKAKNGVCEEGRAAKGEDKRSAVRLVYCDLGTDCEDCGPWLTSSTASAPWETPGTPGPITLLMSKDVQVRVRSSTLPSPYAFEFAYTDPAKDFDVSYHAEQTGMVEAAITSIFYKILHNRCEAADGTRKLFVDVGANFGWFAVMAAKLGCRVISFEPVPHFRAFFEYSVWLNDLQGLIEIRTDVVNQAHGSTVKFVVPARGIWGTAGIDGMNIDVAIQSAKEELELTSVALSEVIKEDVLLLKVDVEGFECYVVEGAAGLLKDRQVENIIMEYSPGVPERAFNFKQMADTPKMLQDLIGLGYRIGLIGEASKHQSGSWDGPAAELTEVTSENLKYDVKDVELWTSGQLGCPVAPELQQFQAWRVCGAVPEDINPRSLRSEIGHNTNLWMSKNTELLRLSGVVGIVDPKAPKEQFFLSKEDGGLGQGSRICAHLDHVVQVRHRCRCTQPEKCGAEQQAVIAAAAANKLPHNYVLP